MDGMNWRDSIPGSGFTQSLFCNRHTALGIRNRSNFGGQVFDFEFQIKNQRPDPVFFAYPYNQHRN